MTLPRARVLGADGWPRFFAKWFAPWVQVYWALAAACAGIAIYLAANSELIDAEFDRRAPAYDVVETYHPPSGTGRGRSPESYEYAYAFRDDHGVEHRGQSYAEDDVDTRQVEVEYVSDDPSTARLVGARSQSTPAYVTIIILALSLMFAGGAFLWARRDAPRPRPQFDPQRSYRHLAILPAATVALVVIAIVVLLIPR